MSGSITLGSPRPVCVPAPTFLGRVLRLHSKPGAPGSSFCQHSGCQREELAREGWGCSHSPLGYPPTTEPCLLGLMDSRGTVMLARESSGGVGCCEGAGGSGDVVGSRLAAPKLGELPLFLVCRSRSVSRGAGCCFSLHGGQRVTQQSPVVAAGWGAQGRLGFQLCPWLGFTSLDWGEGGGGGSSIPTHTLAPRHSWPAGSFP